MLNYPTLTFFLLLNIFLIFRFNCREISQSQRSKCILNKVCTNTTVRSINWMEEQEEIKAIEDDESKSIMCAICRGTPCDWIVSFRRGCFLRTQERF